MNIAAHCHQQSIALCTALLAAAIFAAPCQLAMAEMRFERTYVGSVAGIPIGEGVWTITIDDKDYAMRATGRVTGLLGWVIPGEGSVAVRGTVRQGRFWATNYWVDVKSKKSFTVTMDLNAGTVRDVSIEPPTPPNRKNIPVADADRREVSDPMSAGIIPVAGAGTVLNASACKRTLQIFDGTQRFDLALTFKRMEEVQADEGYRGPAVVCGVTYRPIAGYNPNRSTIKYLVADRDIELWLTPVADTRFLMPYRVSSPTTIGTAVLQAR